jgi:hypothetical protein
MELRRFSHRLKKEPEFPIMAAMHRKSVLTATRTLASVRLCYLPSCCPLVVSLLDELCPSFTTTPSSFSNLSILMAAGYRLVSPRIRLAPVPKKKPIFSSCLPVARRDTLASVASLLTKQWNIYAQHLSKCWSGYIFR